MVLFHVVVSILISFNQHKTVFVKLDRRANVEVRAAIVVLSAGRCGRLLHTASLQKLTTRNSCINAQNSINARPSITGCTLVQHHVNDYVAFLRKMAKSHPSQNRTPLTDQDKI